MRLTILDFGLEGGERDHFCGRELEREGEREGGGDGISMASRNEMN